MLTIIFFLVSINTKKKKKKKIRRMIEVDLFYQL